MEKFIRFFGFPIDLWTPEMDQCWDPEAAGCAVAAAVLQCWQVGLQNVKGSKGISSPGVFAQSVESVATSNRSLLIYTVFFNVF